MNKNELIKLLKKIKLQDFTLDNGAYDELAFSMFEYIGDTDPELRDSLIYIGYCSLIMNNRLSKECLHKLFFSCIDEKHLLWEVGTSTGDSVFTRSFCILLLVGIIEMHNEDPFLSKDEVLELVNLFCNYYEEEKNLTGYTKEKGWAHTAAHGADLLASLCSCKEVEKEHLERILQVIQRKICQGDYVFIDDEPSRMMPAIMKILDTGLFCESQWIAWFDTFVNSLSDKTSIEYFHLQVNMNQFFRVLYFYLKKHGGSEALLDAIFSRVENET